MGENRVICPLEGIRVKYNARTSGFESKEFLEEMEDKRRNKRGKRCFSGEGLYRTKMNIDRLKDLTWNINRMRNLPWLENPIDKMEDARFWKSYPKEKGV